MFEDFTEEIRKVPMFRLLLPFLLGLASYRMISASSKVLFILLVILYILFIYFWQKKKISYKYTLRWVFGLIANILLFLSGLLYPLVYESRPYLQNIDDNTHFLITEVIEIPEEREKTFKLILKAKAGIVNDSISITNGKLLAYVNKDSLSSEIKIGDRLFMKNKFLEITNSQNPYEFDYKRYLWNQGIRKQGFFRHGEWYLADSLKGNPIKLFAANLRQRLLSLYLHYGLSGDEYAVASALTLGYKAALDEDIKRSYSTSGAMHVLAVSGLHVGIIYIVLNYLLLFFTRIKGGSVARSVILLLCLWFYAILTGLSPSVMRAATMFSFVIIGNALKRPANIYNSLSASAFFLIILNPNIFYAVGFQLSYTAVIGIVFFQPKIYKLLYVKNKILDKIWALTTVSVGAQIGTFPLSLFYFNQFPGLFFVTNLFVIPLATLILYSGILLFVTSYFSTLAFIISIILNWLVWFLNEIVKFIEAIPVSHISGIFIYPSQLPIIYLLIASLTLFMIRKHAFYLKLSLSMMLILTVFWSFRIFTASSSRQLIIYNVNNRLAVNYLGEGQNILITGDISQEAIKQIEYPAKGVWTRFRANPVFYYSFFNDTTEIEMDNLFGHGQFWSFKSVTMVIADASLVGNFQPDYPVDIDLLVLTGKSYIPSERISELFNPAKIIISSAVPYWLTERYFSELDAMNLSCYDVRTQGAFFHKLR
jgi:competence protein ComEC